LSGGVVVVFAGGGYCGSGGGGPMRNGEILTSQKRLGGGWMHDLFQYWYIVNIPS